MTDYYTNVQCVGNNILYRGIKNGRRVRMKIEYQPTLYLPTKKPSKWKTLEGTAVEPMKFSSIREARDFVRSYENVDGFKIFGNASFQYAYISENNTTEIIPWELDNLVIGNIDIEVGSSGGFPYPDTALEPITAITIKLSSTNMFYVFGTGEYKAHRGDVVYHHAKDEYTLIKQFLSFWKENYPDMLTGWNTKFFDIPYMTNRFRKIVGEQETKALSPWNLISERSVNRGMGKEDTTYEWNGISQMDYLEMYKWYAPDGTSQESYRLDHIAEVELGMNKLSYDEYDNLFDLYKRNYQLFIEYNIKDVELVDKLDEKLRLLELCLTLAYDTKTNYEDVFAQTRMWDSLIYNNLIAKNIVVPPKVIRGKDGMYVGAYVKDPQVGMHKWIASFDLNSLYPHLMMQYNISPEMLVEPEQYTDEMRKLVCSGIDVDKMLNRDVSLASLEGVTCTPNGQFFRTDRQGFLPKMMEDMYESRKKFKKMMLVEQQNYENSTDKDERLDLSKKISRYNNLQLAKKLSLNSAYGAMGSQYFRFFDLRLASAITLAGQLSIRWIEGKINTYVNSLLKTEGVDYVIASDTDSIYLNMGPIIDKFFKDQPTDKTIKMMDKICEDKIQPFINKSYQELADYVHAYAQKMQMKREALADKAIWTAKKRYILHVHNNEGVQYAKPKMKIMGLEAIKSSTPSSCRDKIKESLQIIMTENEKTLQAFVATFKSKFKTLPLEEISFPRSVNGLTKYAKSDTIYDKGTPMHVKASLVFNHFIKEKNLLKKYELIKNGDKIKYISLLTPNPFKNDTIAFQNRIPQEFELEKWVDYNLQFKKAFLDPLDIVLNSIGWAHESRMSIDDFFS